MAQWVLRGYDRTPVLEPGVSMTLSFTLAPQDLTTVALDGSRSVTGGDYTVHVGGGHPRDSKVPSNGVKATISIKPECRS